MNTRTKITSEQAIELAKTRFWERMTSREIAEFQLFTDRLCMPFEVFHKAVTESLGRPVWTHEFAGDRLGQEFLGHRPKPSFDEIVNLIPADKRVIIVEAA